MRTRRSSSVRGGNEVKQNEKGQQREDEDEDKEERRTTRRMRMGRRICTPK